jgi:MSHA biogenesis protein MshN
MGIFPMSVINRMLQDLDARGVSGAGDAPLHSAVRSVPAHRGSRAGWRAILLLALLLPGWAMWNSQHPGGTDTQPYRMAVDDALSLKIAAGLSAPAARPAAAAAVEAPAAIVGQEVVGPDAAPHTPATPVGITKAAAAEPVPPADAVGSGLTEPAAAERQTGAMEPQAPPQAAITSEQPGAREKQATPWTPPQRAENAFRQATALIARQKTEDAVAVLRDAIAFDPLHAAARQTLAGLLLESGDGEQAMQVLEEGLAAYAGQPGIAMLLARLQLERDGPGPAADTLQRSLSHAVDDADYQAFLAALRQRQARHADAIGHYSVALRHSPRNAVWWMGLAISLQAEQRLAEARAAFAHVQAMHALSPELQRFVEQRLAELAR